MTENIRKIAVVIPKYGLVGGAERFVRELTERIAHNPRYDVHVFANRWKANSERVTFHKVPIITFPKFLTTVSFALFAHRKMAKMKFDLIHAHDRVFHAHIFTMHCNPHRMWVRDARKKKVMSLFDYATILVEKRLINDPGCAVFLPVSNLTKEAFLEEYNLKPHRMRVVHPGVNVEEFNLPNRDLYRHEIRERFGIDLQETVILFVSMNFEMKGLDRLMGALARLKTANRSDKVKLLVVGKGDVAKYTGLAWKMGIGEDIVFAGLIEKEKIAQIYLASDIYTMLSKFDTFGMAVLEAMAASLPVIVGSKVGAKDMVIHGGNGFVVEEEMGADEIASLIGLLLDRELRIRMGQEAYQTAIANTWEVVAKKVEMIYEQLLFSPSPVSERERT